MERQFYFSDKLEDESDKMPENSLFNPVLSTKEAGNLIGSQTEVTTIHMPLLDIDDAMWSMDLVHGLVAVAFPELQDYSWWSFEPSTGFETNGNYHIYIDIPVRWEINAQLLSFLGEMGILGPGFVKSSLVRGCAFLRPPWVHKTASEPLDK